MNVSCTRVCICVCARFISSEVPSQTPSHFVVFLCARLFKTLRETRKPFFTPLSVFLQIPLSRTSHIPSSLFSALREIDLNLRNKNYVPRDFKFVTIGCFFSSFFRVNIKFLLVFVQVVWFLEITILRIHRYFQCILKKKKKTKCAMCSFRLWIQSRALSLCQHEFKFPSNS